MFVFRKVKAFTKSKVAWLEHEKTMHSRDA